MTTGQGQGPHGSPSWASTEKLMMWALGALVSVSLFILAQVWGRLDRQEGMSSERNERIRTLEVQVVEGRERETELLRRLQRLEDDYRECCTTPRAQSQSRR